MKNHSDLTAKEAAIVVGRSYWTVYKMWEDGEIQGWRWGSRGHLHITNESLLREFVHREHRNERFWRKVHSKDDEYLRKRGEAILDGRELLLDEAPKLRLVA